MAKMKYGTVKGFFFFDIKEKYNITDTESILYHYMVSRLMYINKENYDGNFRNEDFNIDDKGFGRFSLTYKEAKDRLGIHQNTFNKAIYHLNNAGLLYLDQVTTKLGHKVNLYKPVLQKGMLDWTSWSFRVWLMDDKYIEVSEEFNSKTVEEILFDETEKVIREEPKIS